MFGKTWTLELLNTVTNAGQEIICRVQNKHINRAFEQEGQKGTGSTPVKDLRAHGEFLSTVL